jgi:hypothetical protein
MAGNDSTDVIIEIVGPLPPSGSRMVFKGLSTPEPLLEFEDGTTFVGEFQEVVGTMMVFSEEREISTGDTPAESAMEDTIIRKGEPRKTTLECLQDKKIVFKRK